MKSRLAIVIVALIATVGLVAYFVAGPTPTEPNVPTEQQPAPPLPPPKASFEDLIEVDGPLPGDTVTSPLIITGRARGGWYFEAIFPVTLLDASDNVIASGTAQAQSDWMTSDYVPFSATLTFSPPASATGTLVLKNSNPSGEPVNDKELRIPVTF